MNIGFKEDLYREFKSDRTRLPDGDIIEAVAAFANTEGGTVYLGVEDDGEVTGLNKTHRNASPSLCCAASVPRFGEGFCDIVSQSQLAAFIANKTVPPVSVSVEQRGDYLMIIVPKSRNIVATSSGKLLRRRIKANGEPENVPMYPHEISTRLSDLSMLDYTALPVPGASRGDLDGAERERLRGLIRTYSGERELLDLDDEELDKALRPAVGDEGTPTYCGMLLIGRADRLRELVPTAEASFQVLEGTSVAVNESFRAPLLGTIEKIRVYMDAHNHSVETGSGMYRRSVFDFDKRAFREALVNAFCHRDYTMLGMVRVLLDDDGLTISSPGKFIDGVTIENLLTAEPHGRNPALADALKRIGLAERTGRGIDRIYEGSLMYGRRLPDYSESTDSMVKLFIPRERPDNDFIELISRSEKPLSVNSLLILNELKRRGSLTLTELAGNAHITEARASAVLEQLLQSGIIQASGKGYGLAFSGGGKDVSHAKKPVEGYTAAITEYARAHGGKITRGETSELLGIDLNAAYRQLKKLADSGVLEQVGKGKYAYYGLVLK